MSEIRGKYAPKKKDPLKPFYPVIGLVFAAIAAAVGFFASPFVLQLLKDTVLSSAVGQLPADDVMQIVIGVMIFLVMIALFGMIFAMFAPRPDKLSTDQAVIQEKREREIERQRAKMRGRNMKEKMRTANKNKDLDRG
jgi:uncharacterized membrane protein (DUF106 family)